jgi:mono/diheme cytochrome c family protein
VSGPTASRSARSLAAVLLLTLVACDDNMASHPRRTADDPGVESHPAVPPGSAPRGSIVRAAARWDPPGPLDEQVLRRGQDRYQVFCAPCHGYAGHGDGMVTRHGFPRPASLHQERLRQAPRQHVVDVITNGRGLMRPYADMIEPADRWAIAGYVQALQISQAALAEAPPDRPPFPGER